MEAHRDAQVAQTVHTTMVEVAAQAAQTAPTTMGEVVAPVVQTDPTTMAGADVGLAQPNVAIIAVTGVILNVALDVEAVVTMLVIVAIPCAAMALKALVQVAVHNAKRTAPRLVLMDVIDK